VKELFVYYEEKKVGNILVDEEEVYSFRYEKQWVTDKEAFPLSLALPLSDKIYGNKLTLSFFENLLPEGDVRNSIEKNKDIHGAYAFLKEFGSDCAGAIIISSHEMKNYAHSGESKELSLSKIEMAIENKRPVTELLSSMKPGYLSLAGAQDKFPAIYKNKKFYIPIDRSPTTHIVKAPIWRHRIKESVYNEFYCMTLGKMIGFKIPNFFIVKHKHPLFVIERYDRTIDQNKIRRIHQQDFCQAQGIMSSSKYEAEGGPSIKDDYELLRKSVSPKHRFRDINLFLEWISFNLIIGNNDSHSKNISFLMHDGIQLAPFYDLICTEIYPDLKNKFSFFVGGRNEADKIGRNQFSILNKELELKEGTFEESFSKVMKSIEDTSKLVTKNVLKEYPDCKIAGRIEQFIRRRIKGFKKRL
jgi:serine/threonine-protein kinase HipA